MIAYGFQTWHPDYRTITQGTRLAWLNSAAFRAGLASSPEAAIDASITMHPSITHSQRYTAPIELERMP